MRILVTGGSGLVGRYIVQDLQTDHEVEILDLKKAQKSDVPLHFVDILDADMLKRCVKGYDVVVHLAGIPHPLNHPADVVFRTNTVGTYNVLEACAANGIQKFIFISSESVLGFAFSTTRMSPEYLPVNEEHPLRPQDPYALSKVACEQVCKGFTRRTGMQTICLRPPWIWVPEPNEIAFYHTLRSDYPKWYKNLWAYIHVSDVARAVRLCVEKTDLPSHDAYFICAPHNWTGVESRALAVQFYPETKRISEQWSGDASFISTAKAERAFGFEAAHGWKEIMV